MPTLSLLPKQIEFLKADEFEVLYSGAVRAAKSYALCVKTVMRANRKGAREMLWRKYQADLKATTLKTLLEGDGLMPPVLPPGSYHHNKADKTIKLASEGEIVYGGMVSGEGKDQRVGSYSATGVNLDESIEFAYHEYRMLASRASVKLPGLPLQVNMATNPGSPSHWIAVMYGLAPDTPVCPPNRRVIRTRSHDNYFLSKEYLAFLDTTAGLWRKRYVEGLWVGSDGLVYDKWDRQVHVQPWGGVARRVVLGVDDGYTNPFCVLRLSLDGDGRICVQREFYQTGQLMAQRVDAVRSMADGADAVVVDPSAAGLIAELRNAGLNVVEADNAVFDGIGRVQQRLAVVGDGLPRLTVDPSCTNTMREMETYEWKNTRGQSVKDEPVKENDHAMDTLRYAVMHLDSGVVVGASVVGAIRSPGPAPAAPTADIWAERRKNQEWGWERVR